MRKISSSDLVYIFVNKIQYFPAREEYADIGRDELGSRIIRIKPGFPHIKENIDDYDDDQLRGILTLLTYHIDECVRKSL